MYNLLIKFIFNIQKLDNIILINNNFSDITMTKSVLVNVKKTD